LRTWKDNAQDISSFDVSFAKSEDDKMTGRLPTISSTQAANFNVGAVYATAEAK